MAIGDIKTLSFDNAAIDSSVSVEATARTNGDNNLKTDITDNVRGKEIGDTETDSKAQLIENQIPTLRTALNTAISARKTMYGDPAVETIDGGVGFATKFGTVKSRTETSRVNVDAAGGDQTGVENDASTEATRLTDLQTKVDNILNNVDGTFDNVKEAFDHIAQMKTDDETQISGFTTTRNAEMDVLIKDELFNDTTGYLYKDKNSDTYYRMYVTDGNLITEEVNAPA
jgi:hypothetical protein